jgi:hypothetical protein
MKRESILLLSFMSAALVSLATGCVSDGGARPKSTRAGTKAREGTKMAIQLTSPAFKNGEVIPVKHTCDGEDLSPPLEWSGVPPSAKSLALICDDPDAPVGTWVHWVLYWLPSTVTALPEGVPAADTVLGGARQGANDFKRIGHGGPCPPPGKPHRYFFRLYALDTVIDLDPGATKKELLRAMEKHIVAQGELMGKYGRK